MEKTLRNPVAVAVLTAAAVGIIGGTMTDTGAWYDALEKPSFNPPKWAFAPAWTVIYACAVAAAVTGWRATRNSRDRAWLVSLFFMNAVLNILWSALFFTAHHPDWALAEVATLWLSVLALIVFFWRFSKPAAAILAPYLVWVTFAGVLNLAIVQLNGPF